ncbi:MAG: hypothetical protein IPK28_18480 [Devosia sp.]|nr:hypothetical protein [Devosia sp.]
MLDIPTSHLRQRLAAAPVALLEVLPRIGRLMITASHLGATHERIGSVEGVTFRDGWAGITGAAHWSQIELAAIAEVVVDRTSVMQGRAYPRIDLFRADGSVLAGIVGFEGLEPFDAALASLGAGEPLPPLPERPVVDRTEAGPGDLGLVALEAARESGRPVVIGFRRPGFEQSWQGVVDTVRPAMGFVNVMRSDFHLHLRAGAVALWRPGGGRQHAHDAGGSAIGLSVEAT